MRCTAIGFYGGCCGVPSGRPRGVRGHGAAVVYQQLEIELALLQVGTFYADAYGVAQRHAATRRAADDLVIGFVELEEITFDVAQE